MNTGKHADSEVDTRSAGTTALVRTLFPIVAVAFSAVTVLCSAAMALSLADRLRVPSPSRSPT